MRKTRILIASLLKPVNDTRMYEKMGRSLAKLPDTEIHICGYQSPLPDCPEIHFHPLFHFKRLSFNRLTAQGKYWQLLLKVKPDAIIVNTYELLLVSLTYSILFNAKLYYDIRENYYRNIASQPTFPKLLRPVLAGPVRLLERLSSSFVTHFFLAEKCYADELTFLGENYTVLENKYQALSKPSRSVPVKISPESLNLLYSGTIAEIYGIWEAIELCEKIHKLNPNVRLTIIGYCAQESILERLKERIKDKPYITLIGGASLVPHKQIIEAIQHADVGLLPYRPNPSTFNCVPTKLFEYLANGLPVLIPENPAWESRVEAAQAGFSIDFTNPNAQNILDRLFESTFYSAGLPNDVTWQSEEEKLLSFFNKEGTNT